MKKNSAVSRIILTFCIVFSFTITNVFAAFPADFFPQAGQNAEWTTNTNGELCFNGAQPGFGPATVATTFGGLVSNDYTGLTLKFDAIISSDGSKNTTIVLSSNGTWGSKGIVLEMNKYQIRALNNFDYANPTMLSTDVANYQNNIVKPDFYNSFIINISPIGVITITINGYVCPTSYSAALSVLQAVTPVPRFVYFSTDFTGFKLKNLSVQKSAITKQYFMPPLVPLSGTYYIDATSGSDAASGLSIADAWKSFDNINKTTLSAGTKILLKKGSIWNQRLEIRGAGTVSNWIQVDSYGTSPNKPKISLTNNPNDIAILICDLDKTSGIAKSQSISYIKVQNLEIADTRLGIYYRVVTGTTNTGFKVDNVTFTNINCDPVMNAVNTAASISDVAKENEITAQLFAIKGNLETLTGSADGGSAEYIFPAGVLVGGKTLSGQTVSGTHTTVLTEWETSNCDFNEAISGIMSIFYWPVIPNGDGSDIWQQVVHKVRMTNCTGTGIVNGIFGLDCVNSGAITDADGAMKPDADGWGLFKNLSVTMGSAVSGRAWPNGTTATILSNCRNMLVDSCNFSDVLNQNYADGCGFDFETNCHNVTIQNTKFINNDGHAFLMQRSGNFGGSSNITIQKNLFAKNLKNSTTTTEMLFTQVADGHTNIKVLNNQTFMRKKNKNNADIYFLPNRSYITSRRNDQYYLDDSQPEITISFLGQPYTYKAGIATLTGGIFGTGLQVTTPQVSKLLLKSGELVTTSRTIPVYNEFSLINGGTPASYQISENASFTGATWILYNSNLNYQLSAGNGSKTVYFRIQNVRGVSPTFSSAITLTESVLPVNLVKFEATKKENGNLLSWETASEINNSHYIVYRSEDGNNFIQIAKITAENQASKYQFVDTSPISGNNYYKLVQVDFDGKSELLGIKALRFDLQVDNTVSIYPNPAYDRINLNFNRTFKNDLNVRIYDLNGKELQKATIPSQKNPVNYVLDLGTKVTSGVYIISISSGQFKHSEKIIIK